MKIGIYGGSFNPIHIGHVSLAKNILQENIVDELWFVVSPRNPLKNEDVLEDDFTRLSHVRDVVAGIDRAKVSDVEFHLPKPSYMYMTLKKIQEQCPKDILFLIIGADNWLCFKAWKNYEEILEKYNILIYPRQGYKIDSSVLPSNVKYLEMPIYNISSSQIRDMVSRGEDIIEYMP